MLKNYFKKEKWSLQGSEDKDVRTDYNTSSTKKFNYGFNYHLVRYQNNLEGEDNSPKNLKINWTEQIKIKFNRKERQKGKYESLRTRIKEWK